MIREIVYFTRTTIPWVPPFVALVMLFMLLCMALYLTTRSRGYLVTFLSGFLYLVPWFLTCVLR